MPWMKALSDHYLKMKEQYPEKQLLLVWDIDDSIVDIRLPLLYVLKKYDHVRGSHYFDDFDLENIVFEEWRIQNWLPGYIDDQQVVEDIVAFVRANMWQEQTILLSHRPFRGVLETIRWFKIQERTEVGLNTGRAEELRDVTLNSLNILGKEYRIQFSSELLYMNPLKNEATKDILSYKSKGIRYFQDLGYKVIAFIDNEPANLKAVADSIDDPDIMLLHADTMFSSSRQLKPDQAISGQDYDLTEIVDPQSLPKHVEFVWNGVNKQSIFETYRQANVYWAEVDVRRHPLNYQLVCKHSSFDAPDFDREEMVDFKEMARQLIPLGKGLKVVLKENILEDVLDLLEEL